MTPIQFAEALITWHHSQGRKHLPWQQDINPYRVWVSEIMLQQTQVATVIPYFQRFMQRFPNIQQLAAANEDEVLALWTGLGYYARGRNLLRTAKIIQEKYHGKFPDNIEDMQQLPGIGRSTAGAILAIALNKSTAILDGNVKRVFTRFFAIEDWPGETTTLKYLWQLAEQYTPQTNTAIYTQAIMDLGATICVRGTPDCERCPLNQHCQAFLQGKQSDLPIANPKRKVLPIRQIKMLLICDAAGTVLLHKRPANGIWGSLWSLPECPVTTDVKDWCSDHHYQAKNINPWPSFRHTFSHFHLDITPVHIEIAQATLIMDSAEQVWHKTDHSLSGGLASPVKRLLSQLTNSLETSENA